MITGRRLSTQPAGCFSKLKEICVTADKLIQVLNRGCLGGLTAIRSVNRLQPAGGAGDKVFPPTYEKGTYAFETRMIDGKRVESVLLDSVQSQANRFEDALLEAYRSGSLKMPVFEIDIPGHETVTSLTVPHRVHDAILRDSLWNGQPFRESENGKRLVSARAWNATPFYEFAPTALLLGTWDSQSGGGVNTAKIARSLVSEIIALDAVRGVRTSSRIDPLGIKLVRDVIVKTGDEEMWRFVDSPGDGKKGKKAEGKPVRPSEINHGNVTPTITDKENGPGGVTFGEAVQTTVLSLTQLRKLRFPDAEGATAGERDVAGRAVIAALGLYAVTLSQEDGYQLRSRCQLIPMEAAQFELLGRTEKERETFELDSEAAGAALSMAIDQAEKYGLKWHAGRIDLQPRQDLVKLVEFSDHAMAAAEGE
jgi:CRISPR-associated protein Csb1